MSITCVRHRSYNDAHVDDSVTERRLPRYVIMVTSFLQPPRNGPHIYRVRNVSQLTVINGLPPLLLFLGCFHAERDQRRGRLRVRSPSAKSQQFETLGAVCVLFLVSRGKPRAVYLLLEVRRSTSSNLVGPAVSAAAPSRGWYRKAPGTSIPSVGGYERAPRSAAER